MFLDFPVDKHITRIMDFEPVDIWPQTKRMIAFVGHIAKRLAGYMPEEPLAPHSDHDPLPEASPEEMRRFNWQQPSQRVDYQNLRFPHGSEGDYYDDGA